MTSGSERTGGLLIGLDVLVLFGAYLLALLTREMVGENVVSSRDHIQLLPLILSVQMLSLVASGAYIKKHLAKSKMTDDILVIVRSFLIALGVIFGLIFLFRMHYLSRGVLGLFALYAFVLLLVERVIIRKFSVASLLGHSQVALVIGCGGRGQRLVKSLQENPDLRIHVIGYVDRDKNKVGEKLMNVPVLGTIDDISQILGQNVIDEVIVAVPRSQLKDFEEIAFACEEQGVNFRFMADMFDLEVARMSLAHLGEIPLLTFEPVAHDEVALFLKRLLDIAAVLISLPIILPVFLVIAIMIKLDSRGPVFFVQERVGYRKRGFKMYKFRSMSTETTITQEELESMNEADGPIFKIANDPRVTKVGRFIRKTSLDELPQLINVLKGDMSLVGPRPMSLRDVNRFDRSIQRKRFSVRPGMTCLWQVSGRSNLNFDQWLALDLEYISRWSLGLDFKILLQTIPAVLAARGAV
ncbi:MAG: exopolysaccharide biosynthesis polyprenyl glycosylphosphotransferase [Gammaproteobacteria bacterium]|nr:exopolysaccharide biosynthesis polyprenyl glycosylphosphotransferase [Gammaproteobacteria bacterium]